MLKRHLAAAWGFCLVLIISSAPRNAAAVEQVKVRITCGHQSPARTHFYMKPLGSGIEVTELKSVAPKTEDGARAGAFDTRAGGGDVGTLEFVVQYTPMPVAEIRNLHPIWRDLIAGSDADSARRLRSDPAYRRDPRRLTLEMNPEGTRGFSLTIDQLLANKAFWVPSLDVYVATGEPPVAFEQHQAELKAWSGKRILDQVHAEDEATYAQFVARWEDMGSPSYVHPHQPAPGHIVCLAWDSSLHKFGVDCGAGVWNDYGNPDRFRFSLDFGRLGPELARSWRGQGLSDGLPVVHTTIERDGIRYEIEQFAYPLNGPPSERRGDIPMVLLQKLKLTNLTRGAREVSWRMLHERRLPSGAALKLDSPAAGTFVLREDGSKPALLCIEAKNGRIELGRTRESKRPEAEPSHSAELLASLTVPGNATGEVLIKLPSPQVPAAEEPRLLAVGYDTARTATLKFWSDYLAKGAQFRVPEAAVNELFRANLWHALRLPRRHGAGGPAVAIDLPYSNFAYAQKGIPWPINQGVYVDYMLYDLRGHHDIAAEELLAIYRANQEPNGHVRGYANWVVYTPGMVYASAKHYLLSGSPDDFERLLTYTLKAADWCILELERTQLGTGPAGGLVRGPLNDLTGDGVWAFNQAYVYAGFEVLGLALERIGHPRAQQFRDLAQSYRERIERSFGAASTHSPLVQLRDHTWTPYVPCEALSSGRRMDQWYPTDVDTGAMHLPRLKAIAIASPLLDCLLNDHEDNLYLKGWGMANEPVYNQQATVYLLRDDPQAVIRAFYSMMACAFSQNALEPVEHRWTHGQYFGPPSTDGAWFELYRNMLIQEREDGSLLLMAATPRRWLEDGKRIEIERAPTCYGPLDVTVQSLAASGTIRAEIQAPQRNPPQSVLLRLRHPEHKPMRWVKVNGQDWSDFDPKREQVRIAGPDGMRKSVVVGY